MKASRKVFKTWILSSQYIRLLLHELSISKVTLITANQDSDLLDD